MSPASLVSLETHELLCVEQYLKAPNQWHYVAGPSCPPMFIVVDVSFQGLNPVELNSSVELFHLL